MTPLRSNSAYMDSSREGGRTRAATFTAGAACGAPASGVNAGNGRGSPHPEPALREQFIQRWPDRHNAKKIVTRFGIDFAAVEAWVQDLRSRVGEDEYFFSLNRYLFLARKNER
jgi:hypothetical protein